MCWVNAPRDPAKFEKFRDKAQAMLEAALKLEGPVKSYKIVEAEKIKDEAASASKASGEGGANGKPSSAVRTVAHDGVIIRVDVQFECGTGEFDYTFFLIDGIWKSAGLTIGFRADSE